MPSLRSLRRGGDRSLPPIAIPGTGHQETGPGPPFTWAQTNIQSNAILPGWFMTELTSDIPLNQPERYDLISRRIPTGRWGETQEMQGAVVFLASPASDYVTGAVLTVDGGYSVM